MAFLDKTQLKIVPMDNLRKPGNEQTHRQGIVPVGLALERAQAQLLHLGWAARDRHQRA